MFILNFGDADRPLSLQQRVPKGPERLGALRGVGMVDRVEMVPVPARAGCCVQKRVLENRRPVHRELPRAPGDGCGNRDGNLIGLCRFGLLRPKRLRCD